MIRLKWFKLVKNKTELRKKKSELSLLGHRILEVLICLQENKESVWIILATATGYKFQGYKQRKEFDKSGYLH